MSEQVISRKTYTTVFLILMVLLALSVVAAGFDWGRWNTPVALGISGAKAVLIILFFMHLIHSSVLTRLVAFGGLLWLVVLFAFTLGDYQMRGWESAEPQQRKQRFLDRAKED